MNKWVFLSLLLGTVWAGGSNTTLYSCVQGTKVEAQYVGQKAWVVINGKRLLMQTTRSASGARYIGGGYTWWTKGPKADLYKGTNPATFTLLDRCTGR